MSTYTAYFWWTSLPQKEEIPEKCDDDIIIKFFQVFLVFGVAGIVKSIPSGYSLDAEFNSESNELSQLKFELKHGEICQTSSSKINKYYFIILTIILLISLGYSF